MDNPAVQTAIGPMVIVAADQYEPTPLLRDELAGRFLPGGGRAFVSLARFWPVRQRLIKLTEKRIPGLWAGMLCRKRYIDDELHDAVEAGNEAVVILGSGMDTRAYRLPELAKIPVYEVDLPTNIDRKRRRLEQTHGGVPDNVTLVPADLETQRLAQALTAVGYSGGVKTAFVWEAVTQYLTEGSVRKTFEFLSTAPSGSRLVFTYVRQDFLDGRVGYDAEAAYQDFVIKRQLWKFGMDPSQVAEVLAGYGWRELEQAGSDEFLSRYVRPAGRSLAVSEIERAVSAEKN